MSRPLALPQGSVRALLLLALAARAILDMTHHRNVAPWLAAALLISAAAYFGHRSAAPKRIPLPGPGASMPLPPDEVSRRAPTPLGLPAGTVRTLFLLAAAYGAWLWFQRYQEIEQGNVPATMVLLAFVLGVVLRFALSRIRDTDDAGTLAFEHAVAFVSLIAAAGLVLFGAGDPPPAGPSWVEPALAAVCTFYAGAR